MHKWEGDCEGKRRWRRWTRLAKLAVQVVMRDRDGGVARDGERRKGRRGDELRGCRRREKNQFGAFFEAAVMMFRAWKEKI